MCISPSLTKALQHNFQSHPKKKEKENKLEKKHSFSQNEISAADFSSVDEQRAEQKGKSIFAECQVLSYDKMK